MPKGPRKPKKGSYAEFKQERVRERALFLRQQNNALSRYLLTMDKLVPSQSYFAGYADVIWDEIRQLRAIVGNLKKNPTDEILADKAIELLTQICEILPIAEVMKS